MVLMSRQSICESRNKNDVDRLKDTTQGLKSELQISFHIDILILLLDRRS